MTDEHETAIRNEANSLAGRMLAASGEASLHLARLVLADHDQCLFWYASKLAGALGIEAGLRKDSTMFHSSRHFLPRPGRRSRRLG